MSVKSVKPYQEMSEENRSLDYQRLPFASYVEKYYSSNKEVEDGWKNGFKKTVDMAFGARKDFFDRWGQRAEFFDFQEMENFYDQIKDDTRFDDDVKRFFSFLAGDGYFKTLKIDFNQFVKCNNLNHPHEFNNHPKACSLDQLSKIKGGQNYIRLQLISMGWWK
jgi:hypothetical protein